MKLTLAAAFVLLCLPACIENEELISVRPDGSCTVRLVARGQAQDFAEGYPLPSDPQWRLVRASVPEYLDWLRAGTPSEVLRTRLAGEQTGDMEVELSAEFGSLNELPRLYAPALDPYRSAYLTRTSELEIEQRGGRTVYTFARRFGGREYARFDAWSRMKRALPEQTVRRIERAGEEGPVLDEDELASVAREAALALRGAALAHAEDALLADFTLGSAALRPSVVAEVRARVDARLAELLPEQRLRPILDLLVARQRSEEEAGARLAAIETETRDTLRKSTRAALGELAVEGSLANAILAQLESSLMAQDQTDDLADESFTLRLELPGTLVGGNYDKEEDGAAVWQWKGEALQDREIVLFAVSVVE